MGRRLLPAAGGGGSFSPPPVAIDVDFAWIGGVTHESAVIKARSTDATSMTLAISGAPAVAGVEGADDVWTFTVGGLTPDTVYPFGFVGSDVAGSFRSFPTPGSEASFSVAAGSCAGHVGLADYPGPSNSSNAPTWTRILDREPLQLIHMGDLAYPDLITSAVGPWRQMVKDTLSNDRFKEMALRVPIAYVWDDHDFGDDNSDRTSATRPAAVQVYREYVPSYVLPADSRPGGDGEVYQSWVIGRVRFIHLDTRSSRDPNSDPDNAGKSMLGSDQKAWLMSRLAAATEPVIVLIVQNPWIPPIADVPDSDAWAGFGTEQVELAEFFEDNNLTDRLLLLHGDYHEAVADDGTNTQKDPGSVNPGPRLFAFAPFDGLEADYGYTGYTTGPFFERQQYGVLEFDDQGTQIVVTGTCYEVDDAIESVVFSEDFTFAA